MAEIFSQLFAILLILLAGGGIGYGFIQRKKYQKQVYQKASDAMDSAHEQAAKTIDELNIDAILDESNKRYGPTSPKKVDEK